MWILPKKYQMSCRYAQDTVASKEDLSLPGLSIESSLMWKSRPSQLPTWLRRWNKGGWFQRLSGRILKPCQWTAFETELTLSLGDTRVSPSQQQGSEQVKTTPDTSGRGSDSMWTQLDLLAASSRTSRDTSVSDSERSLATWKALVIQRRGEYSARLKSARLIRESGFTYSVPTPTVGMEAPNKNANTKGPKNLMDVATGDWQHLVPRTWPAEIGTPTASMTVRSKEFRKGRIPSPAEFVQMWPTPTTHLAKEGRPHSSGYLNPDWVEWLMGVPTGWTDLGSWETE